MSLITPREPAATHSAQERLIASRQARHVGRFSELLVAAASSTGTRHAVNEDCHSDIDDAVPVFVVADGVGGGAMAAWASRRVVTRVRASLSKGTLDDAAVREALYSADREVGRGIARRTARSGAATVALCAGSGAALSRWLVAWVGDCRVYRVATGDGRAPELITRDDTYRNLGEAPPPGGSLDDPARMVGNGAIGEPNVARIDLAIGEALLLVTDGVFKHVTCGEMRSALALPIPLAQRCMRLIEIARARGSSDDATALVVCRHSRAGTGLRKNARACALALLAALVVVVLASSLDAVRFASMDKLLPKAGKHSELQG